VGALVALPQGSIVVEDANQHAQADVTVGTKTFRDLMLVMTKDQNHRYADGFPVEHMNGEGVNGLPEDSQESSNMALNYGIEPVWFRFGIAPNAPFGGAGCGTANPNECYGDIPNAHMAYSNTLVSAACRVNPALPECDPATPVFTAKAGQETRMHIAVPHSTSRGSTLAIHGHVWQRDPYVCNDTGKPGTYGLAGKCQVVANGGFFDAAGQPLVGSRALGVNPIGFYEGGRESLTSHTHFDFFLPKAGGENNIPGDYLFRDTASYGNASGLWGILRVTPSP